MAKIETIITDHLDVWSSAIKQRNSQGRGSSKKRQELYGVNKLRAFILDLAMRGQLVPQLDNEDSAQLLLELISKEKEALIQAKVIRSSKRQPINAQLHTHIPKKWKWVRLGDIAQHNAGKTLDKRRNTGEPKPYLTTSNLYWGEFKLDSLR